MRNKKLFFASLVVSLLSFFSFESASLAQKSLRPAAGEYRHVGDPATTRKRAPTL